MHIDTTLLLTPKDFSPTFPTWSVQGVLNPGAVRLPSKEIVLYVRVAESHNTKGSSTSCPIMDGPGSYSTEHIQSKDIVSVNAQKVMFLKNGVCRLPTISHCKRVLLDKTGTTVLAKEDQPAFYGVKGDGDYGVEDPRITRIGKTYYMTYVNVSLHEGVSTNLASSKDLTKWTRHGIIFCEQNKDVVLFPKKIKGKYWALHRPEGNFEFSKPSIWLSASKDLTYWGEHQALLSPRPNSWDQDRIGAGCPPIKTTKGWLCIYHGVRTPKRSDNSVYSAGAFLLSSQDPRKVIARTSSKSPLFAPEKRYEKKGFIGNVIFPTGIVRSLDKKSVLLYCGAADSNVVLKQLAIKDILAHMERV